MVAGSQVGKVQEKPEVRALAWKYSVEDPTRSAATIARMLLEEGELAMPSSKTVDDALQTARSKIFQWLRSAERTGTVLSPRQVKQAAALGIDPKDPRWVAKKHPLSGVSLKTIRKIKRGERKVRMPVSPIARAVSVR